MKDSKNKLKKSSSESKILETKTVPPMPKDKRTKEYTLLLESILERINFSCYR